MGDVFCRVDFVKENSTVLRCLLRLCVCIVGVMISERINIGECCRKIFRESAEALKWSIGKIGQELINVWRTSRVTGES